MATTRRAILKGVAAAPAVAIASKLAVTETVAAALPLPEYPYEWMFSGDGGEIFGEIFDTKEQALQHLAREGYGMIAECQRQDYDLELDGHSIIEMIDGQNEERMGDEGCSVDATKEQTEDLGKMVSATIEAWANKHNINRTAWAFGHVRNNIEHEDGVTWRKAEERRKFQTVTS